MNRQEYFRQQYRKLSPKWRDSLQIYKGFIEEITNAETYLLDVGCGHGDFLQSILKKTPNTYGLDPDADALSNNSLIKNKVLGEVENIPFKNNFFDLVLMEWVLEHLTDPRQAFREIYRVLKPGGKVVFITPNVWNYNVWIIRAIPHCFHAFLTRKLYGRQDGDTYPVQYKINSGGKIKKIMEATGFSKVVLVTNGDPSYISFNKPLFAFARFLEKILDYQVFRFAKVHLIGVYQK